MKTSITIPDDVYERTKKLSGNFSLVVTKALQEYIRIQAVEKAKTSFGKWKGREKDSISIVNEMRSDRGRNYAERSR
ncbi:MAG: hypothetical protein C4550_01440 [Nitrospiraceae bacterium]|nr:MAG: hypothetical protein C4550_01440 [Nitrospiraceae bacterium]